MERVGTIAADPSNLKFSTRLITAMYCYLFLNLLVYYMPGNYLIFKIWVVKACISVLVGYYIATLYAFKMSRLNRYREQNHAAHEELLKRMQEENELHFLAYTDPLTGCCNRKYFPCCSHSEWKSATDFACALPIWTALNVLTMNSGTRRATAISSLWRSSLGRYVQKIKISSAAMAGMNSSSCSMA